MSAADTIHDDVGARDRQLRSHRVELRRQPVAGQAGGVGAGPCLLKPGGEMYFSDVYADRRVPAELAADPVLCGECLAGALYWNDFLHLARGVGFVDPRLVEDCAIAVRDPSIAERVAPVRFFSATYRLFRLPGLEPDCDDYGQAVVYRGTVPRQPGDWALDKHHRFGTGKVVSVCGNTYACSLRTVSRGTLASLATAGAIWASSRAAARAYPSAPTSAKPPRVQAAAESPSVMTIEQATDSRQALVARWGLSMSSRSTLPPRSAFAQPTLARLRVGPGRLDKRPSARQ